MCLSKTQITWCFSLFKWKKNADIACWHLILLKVTSTFGCCYNLNKNSREKHHIYMLCLHHLIVACTWAINNEQMSHEQTDPNRSDVYRVRNENKRSSCNGKSNNTKYHVYEWIPALNIAYTTLYTLPNKITKQKTASWRNFNCLMMCK